ncbi:MAG: hypothetical protein LBU83_07820 [Bacteroidales bacterium]|jgi:hypothetical protein|nr:hypothetical protein [Bacteroidales bacterium]
MKKAAILYIALGRYVVFWKEFFETCEEMLLSCDKHYFIWTDSPPEELEYGDRPNVTVAHAAKRGWPYDSLMRFEMFLEKREEILECNYAFFFNANMKFHNPTDLSEIAPQEWHDGLVAGAHPAVLSYDFVRNPDEHCYERRPESTAYVPFGSGKHYVCGAFNGGTSEAFMKMCATLAKNVQKDLDNGIIACVDDESHLNAYMAKHNYLLAGIAYGFPENELKRLGRPGHAKMIKIISRAKSNPKYGGFRWLRNQTDKKLPTNKFTLFVMRILCRIATWFVPNRKTRKKLRGYYG